VKKQAVGQYEANFALTRRLTYVNKALKNKEGDNGMINYLINNTYTSATNE
jgi:hypothetical protein